MAAGEVAQHDFEVMLEPCQAVFDWHRDAKKGGVVGLSGNRAALMIAGELASKLPKSPLAAREANLAARSKD